MISTYQKNLLIDKLAGFDACKHCIKTDGIVMAAARLRIGVMTNEQAKADLGFWRGWMHALVSDSAVGI